MRVFSPKTGLCFMLSALLSAWVAAKPALPSHGEAMGWEISQQEALIPQPLLSGEKGSRNDSVSSQLAEEGSEVQVLLSRGEEFRLEANLNRGKSADEDLLTQGIHLYQSEQYAAAIDVWTQALNHLETTANKPLRQVLILNNLALAHNQLNQQAQAQDAITQSLDRLASLPASSPDYTETLAKALNTQGKLQWTIGDIKSALDTWRDATTHYRQAGHDRGILLSLLNQAKALQTLGFHDQSKTILEQDVVHLLQNPQLDPTLRATGFWQLGNAQRQLGALDSATDSLADSLSIIETFNLATLRGPVLIDLANTERAQGESAKAVGKDKDAKDFVDQALDRYQSVANSTAPSTQLQANLNRLSLLIDAERWSEVETLWPRLLPDVGLLPPSRTAIYAQLNFAKSLTRLIPPGEDQADQPDKLADTATKAAVAVVPTEAEINQGLLRAIEQAQDLNDPIAESYGVGQRGELYEVMGQWSTAKKFTEQALQLTQQTQYLDGRYRWEWQLGRLLKQQGQQDKAIEAYGAAVKTLDVVRSNLRFIDAEVQFSFRDNVEPVYRELVELLVSSDAEPSQENLDLAIRQIDNLQLSELENFLRCQLAATTAINQVEDAPTTAILYPIILKDRLAVILQLPDGKTFKQVEISETNVEETLDQLRRDLLVQTRTPEVRAAAQDVYQWLIAPFEAVLQQHEEIDTLVFVLDGALRNIPMAVLFDGEQYLIEKYAIAVAPQLDLFTPSALPEELTVFTGGIGEAQTIEELEFPEIEKLGAELDEISRIADSAPPLVGQDFSRQALRDRLSRGTFSAIHLKTHGVFSSDPEDTYIVAHQELIRGRELGDLIRSASRQGEEPLELLVLSACSTATSDSRAVLGLAGIAVRAGARSTLSTLWEAQDGPNTELMIRFYQELKDNPGITRAQALRQAQLALIAQGYRPPHIWATYVLVGNWL